MNTPLFIEPPFSKLHRDKPRAISGSRIIRCMLDMAHGIVVF